MDDVPKGQFQLQPNGTCRLFVPAPIDDLGYGVCGLETLPTNDVLNGLWTPAGPSSIAIKRCDLASFPTAHYQVLDRDGELWLERTKGDQWPERPPVFPEGQTSQDPRTCALLVGRLGSFFDDAAGFQVRCNADTTFVLMTPYRERVAMDDDCGGLTLPVVQYGTWFVPEPDVVSLSCFGSRTLVGDWSGSGTAPPAARFGVREENGEVWLSSLEASCAELLREE